MKKILYAALLTALAGALPASPAAANGPVRLQPSPPVARGIAAFPRVVARPGDAAAARINRASAAADQGLGCDLPKGYWKRSVTVTMRGPRYLSFHAYDDYYRGGAYPDTAETALVFVLGTGAPIDWKQLFPASVIEVSGMGPGGGDAEPVKVSSAGLWKIYAAKAAAVLKDEQCAEVLADPPGSSLMLWPDAAADSLALMQADFPHVVRACGPPTAISLAELRKLGVDAGFLAALDEAHRRGWYDKKK